MLRDQLYNIVLDDVKSCNTIRICYYKYALTTVKARVLNKLLHSLLDGKIKNSVMSWTRHPNRGINHATICDLYSVRICSLGVNMNNIDEKLLLYCRCLEMFNL